MSSQDEQLYNMDSGSVLQRISGGATALQRLEEGKLEASARVDAKETQITEEKESQEEGGLGIGIGSAGVFSGVVGLVKKRAMGVIKTKAKQSLDKLVEKAKANKQALKDKLKGEDGDEPPAGEDGAGGQPPAQADPNATPDNPAPNSADSSNPTYGNQEAVDANPQAPDNLGSEGSEAPARAGDIDDVSVEQAPRVPPRTETTETPQADIETPRIQVTEPDTETPENMNPARTQPDEGENIDNASSQADLDPIESRLATRYNNLDSEAQSRANRTYNNSDDTQQTPEGETQSLENRKDNLSVREDSIQEQELNPDTTFKDPNLSIDQDDPAWSNTQKVRPQQTRGDTYDNPAETQGSTTEGATTTLQEADSVAQEPITETTQFAGRSGDITLEATKAPDIPARNIPAPEPEPTPPAGGDVPTPPTGGGASELQANLSEQTQDAMASFKGNIKSQLGLSDDDAGELLSKIAGGGADIEDIVGAGSDILSSMSGSLGGVLGFLGSTAEVLGPLSAIAGIGMGIYSAIEQGKEEAQSEKKVTQYQSDVQNLSNTTQLQTGSIAMPTMDTSQFRTGGMMNF